MSTASAALAQARGRVAELGAELRAPGLRGRGRRRIRDLHRYYSARVARLEANPPARAGDLLAQIFEAADRPLHRSELGLAADAVLGPTAPMPPTLEYQLSTDERFAPLGRGFWAPRAWRSERSAVTTEIYGLASARKRHLRAQRRLRDQQEAGNPASIAAARGEASEAADALAQSIADMPASVAVYDALP
jgi:hypothetical protein